MVGTDPPKPLSVSIDPGKPGMDRPEPVGNEKPHPDGPTGNPVPLGKGGSEMSVGKPEGRENDSDESWRPTRLTGLALTRIIRTA